MTCPERTNTRSLEFSKWIRNLHPDGRNGFIAANIDWVIWNWKTRKIMFIEEKTHNGKLNGWAKHLLYDLNKVFEVGCKNCNITYLGYHLVQFENTCPKDGKIILFENGFLPSKEISEDELKKFMNRVNEDEHKN